MPTPMQAAIMSSGAYAAYVDMWFAANTYRVAGVTTGDLPLVSGFTFTGASLRTMFDSTGAMTYGPNNLCTYSQEFDNAAWTKLLASITANATTAPDGTLTADKLVEDSSTGVHRALQVTSAAAPIGGRALLTVRLKAAERTRAYIRDNNTSACGIFVDLSNGTLIAADGAVISSLIVPAGNGFYQCSVLYSPTLSPANVQVQLVSTGTTTSYLGDGVSGLYLWGAGLEAVTYATTPSTYYPTTSAAYYGPRLVYDPVTLASLGILVEEARTNVCLWSRDLTNAAWTKTNVTAAKDQTGIDGVASSASKITATAGNGTCLQAITLASSARQQSTYIKRITGSGVVEMTTDNGTTWTAVTVTASWTRVTIPVQTLANPTVGFRIVTSGDAVAIDCVQNETGTGALSPIPTASAAVTRAADVAYVSGLSTLPEFTVWADAIPNTPTSVVGTQTVCGYDDGTATNRVYTTRASGVSLMLSSTGWTYTGGAWAQDAARKVAFTSREGAQTGAFNGTLATPGTSAQPPSLSSLSIGVRSDHATLLWNGTIARIRMYPRVLSDAQLQALTA